MAFELASGELVEAGVRRIVDEQLASARAELAGADPAKADDAVHSARKRFKRVRAVLRLVRDELGDPVFGKENAAFRDTGRSLSEARDAHVLVVTLAALKDRIDASTYAAARKWLQARRRAVRKRVLGQAGAFDAVTRAVDEARARARGWTIARDGWAAIEGGLKRVYRDGRRAYARADAGAPADHFHQWRKRTKDLWHQLELLEPLWPEMLKPLADEVHALADLLGDEHDLAVLNEVIEARGGGGSAGLLDAIEARRGELRRAARGLGARVLAEKPRAFVKRMRKYWRASQEGEERGTPVEPQVEAGIELHVAALPASADVTVEVPAADVDPSRDGE